MKIKIRSVFALCLTDELLSRMDDGQNLLVEVEEGTTVDELLSLLPSLGPPDAFDDLMMHVFVNGKLEGSDHVLQDDDVLDLHIPVSGG